MGEEGTGHWLFLGEQTMALLASVLIHSPEALREQD